MIGEPVPNEKPVQFEGEPIKMITHRLDRRLVEAARRVANKMPKHLTKSTEKELVDSIKRQKDETLKVKKEFENSRKLKEDFTKTISYQIMKESRQSNKSSRQNQLDLELSSRIGSTVEKVKLSLSILDELKTRDQTRSRASRNAPSTINYCEDTIHW
ncbi:hypothetical protein BLOT_013675 [Blomia tropicalis]|nr:hypothetical protein BLOT_013675 [Blomia tropicalis]